MSNAPKTARVMDSSVIADFEATDFLDLAFECLDQADVSVETVNTIRQLLLMDFDGVIMMPTVAGYIPPETID